ncbi:MarR family winged helix-turn-helix transcriptional regulator [Enterococcus sp. HY326]|uniref:MarR family winged helix-turn-helix transcriptional regulator n=1 Tax=Enterococcus sp. HY326 TaxID=2971265 RepID=UPI00223EFEB7|nr:MarR family transcriptional regulator [Enterococcus sp. HY326]
MTNKNDLVQQIAILERDISKKINELLNPLGLNSNNYFYIIKLDDNPNISQKDFTPLVKLNQSSVTRSINSLVEQGLVKKDISIDKRSQLLSLTEEGKSIAAEVKGKIDQLNQQLLLAAEKDSAYEIVKKMQNLLASN